MGGGSVWGLGEAFDSMRRGYRTRLPDSIDLLRFPFLRLGAIFRAGEGRPYNCGTPGDPATKELYAFLDGIVKP